MIYSNADVKWLKTGMADERWQNWSNGSRVKNRHSIKIPLCCII